MARGKQTENYTSSYLSDMWNHLLWFLKWVFIYYIITGLYYLVCYLTGWKFEVIYTLVLNLALPALWYKLRRYRVRDKSKLHFIYLVILLSIHLQILINKEFFIKLNELLLRVGGEV